MSWEEWCLELRIVIQSSKLSSWLHVILLLQRLLLHDLRRMEVWVRLLLLLLLVILIRCLHVQALTLILLTTVSASHIDINLQRLISVLLP